jgi:MOSC domain-containing protein YiiM/ferredoxin-NADP reductase
MKTMRNLSIETGIYKEARAARVFCSSTGLESDEHDLTFHGGVDKAVHQYFPGHYASWRDEYPGNENFQTGAFGENIVCEGSMNERNVCIGDIYRVGSEEDGVVLQVSLPRQPCFKLNHRFGMKSFTPQTVKKSRTGWYYRVLKEGWMGAGDEMVMVERRHPQWTIERIQEYIHRDMKNLAKLEELATINEFGDEIKQGLSGKISALKKSEENKKPEIWREFELVEKKLHTKRISSFIFKTVGEEVEGDELDPGCFARLKLPNGLIRPYSIVSGNSNRFELGIALEDGSRGGSQYLHQSLKEGDKILVGQITASVPIQGGASHHIFIAGGIGITAFFTHFDVFDQINYNYELHYAVRSAEDVPFPELFKKLGSKAIIYDKSKGERMDIPAILSHRKWNSHIYTCGPQRMIDDLVRASKSCGMSQDEIHYEAFQIATSGDPFTVELAKTKKTLRVDGEKTLLETLREAGLEVDSSCETGNCGTCRVEVCSGKVEHRGSALSEEDKGVAMLSCVSRGVDHIVIDF